MGKMVRQTGWLSVLLLIPSVLAAVPGDDLTVTRKVTVGGNALTTQTLVKGQRERMTMDTGAGNPIVTIRQCDRKRSLNVNDAQKTYLVKPDLEENDSSKAAATAMLGGPPPAEAGGTITYTSTVRDTGERKQIQGYTARHLKINVVAQSSPQSCTTVKQKYEIDGWYIDVKDQAGCQRFSPYMKDVQGCHDRMTLKQNGGVKPGMPVLETITMTEGDNPPMSITSEATEVKKGPLSDELFDVPSDYREVKTTAELYRSPLTLAVTAQNGAATPPSAYAPPPQPPATPSPNLLNPALMMNPVAGPAAQAAFQRQAIAQAQQTGLTSPGMTPMGGTPGMGAPQGAASVGAPQALGPKAAGKIRIGVAPPEAQVGQGNNAGADYSTPVRNAIVALMSGPAVEVVGLDSHVAVQLQAEAEQKQCDYILYSSVVVKHSSGGGFGKFMKMAAPLASMAPMAGMGGGMGGAMAGQVAGAAASAAAMSAQQQAMNQLSGFNGQIKSKDDVTVQYQVNRNGQSSPRLQNTLKGKAKSDGEDVLTPLLQQAANSILTEVTKR